ncbi:TPR repeat-containing [Cryptosporidium sp. chipmunk genotype I]|uniref:TPR repeat-containing n=1 Tax=Cryptosporidium sp. chipmunk genotype I TaxID=1280935 RepID=UPI003519FA89|nr:TPR repeat-containing [Cryptosporidium sp. chipmunk genotype I]
MKMEDEKMENTTINSDSEDLGESCESMLNSVKELKDAGNESYKGGNYSDAREKYEKGLELLEKMDQKEGEEEGFGQHEISELRQSLQLNLAMIYVKIQEWSKAIQVTGQVLKNNSKNVKALYRRGLARLGFGMYEESKEDFQMVLKLDPSNADAHRQLKILRQKIQEDNEKSKSGFSRMFHGGLYSDKQQDVERKKKEERERRFEKYSHYLAQIKSKNSEIGSDEEEEEAMPFEEWEKKEIEREKEEQREKTRESERKAKESSEEKPATIISKKNNISNDDVDLDEEDLRILQETKKMGYCYFKRELTEQEKELNRQFTPTLINNKDSCSRDASQQNDLSSADLDKSRVGISSWNSKGTTFEDKDVSEAARSTLKGILLEGGGSSFTGKVPGKGDLDITISIESVDNLSGEASVAMIRGTRRFLFDFSVTLKCKYTIDNNEDEKYPFNINIPSLTSMCNEDEVFGIKDCSIHFSGKHKHNHDLALIKDFIFNEFCLIHLKDRINLLTSEINSQY